MAALFPLVALIAGLLASPAQAYPLDAGAALWSAAPATAVEAGVAGAVAAGLPLLLWQRRRNRRLAGETARIAAENRRLNEILLAAPDGFFRWDADDAQYCSRRLAVMLGLYGGVNAGYGDVLAAFGPAEAAVLNISVAGLRDHGQNFELDLPLRDGHRRVRITGIRATAGDGTPLSDLLWVRDITEESAEADRLAAESLYLTGQCHRLRSLLDALPLPVWMRDGDLALVYCNAAYARAVDAADPESVIAQGIELAAGTGLREARALAARARAAGEARSESFHLVLGGTRRLAEVTEAPLQSVPGESNLITAGFAIDLTRQEDLQGQLARHVAAHAEVLENLSTAIAIFSPDTRLTFFNSAFVRQWGLESDWLAGQPAYGDMLDVLRERRRLTEVADYRAFKGEELRRFTSLIGPVEDLLHLPDETTLRRLISPHPFGGLLFTYEDVTDSLALERSYNTSLAVQRATIDHLHEGVALFGGDGRLRLSNPAFAGIWALAPEDLADSPHISDLAERHLVFFDEADHAATRGLITGLFTEHSARRGRLERGDGVILDYAGVPLPDGAVLVTWLDVSDSAQVERALRERNEALRAADMLKSEFIANVSYEVRTPLNTIVGFSEILTNEYFGALNRRQKDYCRGITEAGQALQALVSDILDLAIIEAGQMALQLDIFDIHAMLVSVLTLTRERVRERNLTLNFDCPLDIGWMAADERRIKQVLFNLISNAVTFTPPGGQIIFAAQREGDQIVFTVADTGVGIPQSEQDRIFHSFTRGSQPEARQHGAGLGLSLVKSFVELHGGSVELISVPGEGTTVHCRLPAGVEDKQVKQG